MNEVREILVLVREGGTIALVVLLFTAWKFVLYPYLQARDAAQLEQHRERDKLHADTLTRLGDTLGGRLKDIDNHLVEVKNGIGKIPCHAIPRPRTIPPDFDGSTTRTRIPTLPPYYEPDAT